MPKGMLGRLPLSAVQGPVDTHYENLAGDEGERVLTEFKKFNRREPCWIQRPGSPLLVFDDEHVALVALSEPHDPAAFWHDTTDAPARYVWSGFTTNVVAKARPTGAFGTVKVPYADLPRGSTVAEILKTPGVGNLEPDHLSPIIAAMIAKQPDGKPMKHGLLVDGRANLFPCGSVLVDVRWDDVRRSWSVDDWNPDSAVHAGRRVFSGNLVL